MSSVTRRQGPERMRILAILAQNLASLARPFELDFTTEPLVASRLFAITGETGSGKSVASNRFGCQALCVTTSYLW